jgi:ankyrin repeat protein
METKLKYKIFDHLVATARVQFVNRFINKETRFIEKFLKEPKPILRYGYYTIINSAMMNPRNEVLIRIVKLLKSSVVPLNIWLLSGNNLYYDNHIYAVWAQICRGYVPDQIVKLKLLLQYGLPFASPTNQTTPLHYAIKCKNYEVVEYLGGSGCPWLQTPDINGSTPLHHAAKISARMVQLALVIGCRTVNTCNHNGETPVSVATVCETPDKHLIIELLNTCNNT